MSRNISSVDLIIRKSENNSSVPDNYKLIYFDERNKALLGKAPSFLQSVGKKIGQYIVSPHEKVKCEGFSYMLNTGIGINLSYSVKCIQDNEEKMLLALFDINKSFEVRLNDMLKDFIRQYFSTQQERLNALLLRKVEEYISQKCLLEIGILLTPVLFFQSESNLSKFQIKNGPFSVRVKDYDETISLEYNLEIWPDEDNLEKALLKLPQIESINSKIKEIVIYEIWKNISLNQLCLSLNLTNDELEIISGKGTVKDILITPINALLKNEGRKIGHLSLSSATVENILPTSQIEIEHLFSYKIADENQLISVNSRVSLRLFNISSFKKAEEKYKIKKSSNNVENWFKEFVITPLIKDVLFDKTYKSILLHPDSIKDEIKDKISAKAEEIGYKIKQHTHLPDIKKLKLKDGFSIHMQDEEFETKSSDIRVKLNISIKGKVRNLDSLEENLLHPAVDIEVEMKNEIRSVIEDEIHTLNPETIYLKFSFTENDELPVDERLSKKVSGALEEKFKVDEPGLKINIKLSQSEDELIRKSKELRRDIRILELTVYPVGSDSYIESLKYEIQYKIIGVAEAGWSTFLSRVYKEVEAQFKELENFLNALIIEKLNSVDYTTLKSENIEIKNRLKSGISKYIETEVAQKFGLHCEFYSFLRKRSESELLSIETSTERFKLEEKAIIEETRHDIEMLQNKIKELEKQEIIAIQRKDLESANEFRDHIDKLKKSSRKYIPEVGNIRKQIENSKKNSNQIENLFKDPVKLLEQAKEKGNEKDTGDSNAEIK